MGRSLRLVLAATSIVAATPLAAQDAAQETSPFRDGQWGVQFLMGSSFSSLGALLFTSPRAAWTLDVRAEVSQFDSDDSTLTFLSGAAQVETRIGRRSYIGRPRSIASFVGGGVLLAYSNFSVQTPVGEQHDDTFGAGVFAEIGASWLVTRSLGLGATADANVGFQQRKITGADKVSGYGFSVGNIAIVASLYF